MKRKSLSIPPLRYLIPADEQVMLLNAMDCEQATPRFTGPAPQEIQSEGR
jgi:hypothetical protein